MTENQIKRPLLILIPLGIVLFLLGVYLHLGGITAAAGIIYGDDGDGFFNIWVMDHAVRSIERGGADILDGRIFWPENEDTFLWSDNLFVPAAGFAFFKAAAGNVLTAFRLTALALSLLGFAAYFFAFYLLYLVARQILPAVPRWLSLFVPIFSYLATFSASRLIYYAHFQNLSSFWLMVMVGGGVGYWHYRRRIFFTLMVISEVLLLYSTPYFAVLGLCFLFAWFLLESCLDLREIPRIIRQNLPVLIVCLLLFTPLAFLYTRIEKNIFTAEYVHQMGMKIFHLYTPSSGPVKNLYESIFPPLLGVSHESPAYPGIGVILAAVGIIIWRLPSLRRWLSGMIRKPWFWFLLMAAIGIRLSGGQWKEYACWMGAVILAAVLLLYAKGMADRARKSPLVLYAAYIALAALFSYGLASGPRSQFIDQPINPSLWGLAAFFIPGAASMRAVGRMAVIGQGLILSLLLLTLCYLYSRAEKRGRIILSIVVCILIAFQFIEGLSARAVVNRYNPDDLAPTTEERAYFAGISGPVAVFPSIPFQASTRPMLYFNHFPDIYLMNGYSARSTALWDRVMGLGRIWREPGEEQMAFLEEQGARYFILWKDLINWRPLKAIRKERRPILFENERVLVLAPLKEK
ncbi:MAG: hypothetical protein V1789_11000 [PVC group bacterium]